VSRIFSAATFPTAGHRTAPPSLTLSLARRECGDNHVPARFTASVFAAEPDVQNPIEHGVGHRGRVD